MQVECFVVNNLGVNAYVVFNGNEGLIIDPGEASQDILDFIRSNSIEVKAIINTHGHADHIAGNAWFMKQTQAPLLIHELDAPYLNDPSLHLGPQISLNIPPVQASRLLKEGDGIEIGEVSFEVLHTPGHSPGGICLYTPGFLFSGDTLFKASIGRSDLPLGDLKTLQDSLQNLVNLPAETVVYPGHGPATTIGEEVQSNPFFNFS